MPRKNTHAGRRKTGTIRSSATARALGRKGGSVSSDAKTAAARENARKPRPRRATR